MVLRQRCSQPLAASLQQEALLVHWRPVSSEFPIGSLVVPPHSLIRVPLLAASLSPLSVYGPSILTLPLAYRNKSVGSPPSLPTTLTGGAHTSSVSWFQGTLRTCSGCARAGLPSQIGNSVQALFPCSVVPPQPFTLTISTWCVPVHSSRLSLSITCWKVFADFAFSDAIVTLTAFRVRIWSPASLSP